jgi:hypothetical protein
LTWQSTHCRGGTEWALVKGNPTELWSNVAFSQLSVVWQVLQVVENFAET